MIAPAVNAAGIILQKANTNNKGGEACECC